MKFDLHMHSHYSDGTLSPAELLRECKEQGLEVVSLTDHDNTDGVPEAVEAGKKLGVGVIPGVEIDSSYQGEEHHLLGYSIDYRDKNLKEFFAEYHRSRIPYIGQIVNNLKILGFKVNLEEVMAQVKGSVHRSHIAWAIFHRNFRDNSPLLGKYGVENSQKEFFQKFFLEEPRGEGLALGGAAEEIPGIREMIELIRAAGGMAFWAHPLWENKDILRAMAKIAEFKKMGLAGMEVCYPSHTQEQTAALHRIAQDFSMYESAGSDFHGPDNSPRQIANFQTFGIEINCPFLK